MRIRGNRSTRRLAVLATAVLSLGASAMVGAAPARADASGEYWDLVAIYDDYNQCVTEGSQWLGGPVIDYYCTYVGGGSTELWVLYG
jgi:hypothetical protein